MSKTPIKRNSTVQHASEIRFYAVVTIISTHDKDVIISLYTLLGVTAANHVRFSHPDTECKATEAGRSNETAVTMSPKGQK